MLDTAILRREGGEAKGLYCGQLCVDAADEIERLRKIVNDVNSWLVCAAIASPEDMAQSFEEMERLTRPEEPVNEWPRL